MTNPMRLNHLQVAPESPCGSNCNSTNLLKVYLNQPKTYYEEREGKQYPISMAEGSYSPIGYKGPKLSQGDSRRDV